MENKKIEVEEFSGIMIKITKKDRIILMIGGLLLSGYFYFSLGEPIVALAVLVIIYLLTG